MLVASRSWTIALILVGCGATAAVAQPTPAFSSTWAAQQSLRSSTSSLGQHVGVELGLDLFGITATRSVIVPQADDYALTFRGVADPLGRFRTDVAATLRPRDRISVSAYATLSTLEDNRFYGFGNQTDASNRTPFYRLDQLLFETGIAARFTLGAPRNELAVGPFYRMLDTDREFDAGARTGDPNQVDDGGIIHALRPYGSGDFRQLGLRADLRLATEGPESGRPLGIRFYGGAAAYAAALDMREPVLSVYGNVKAFFRIPAPSDPTLYVSTGIQRVLGDFPFQDAAYLGGNGSLRGYQSQRFAGDLSLLWSAELYSTLGHLRFGTRRVTVGVMGLADVGRMYNDGVSLGSRHVGLGGGVWFRDQRTGTEVTVSVAQAGAGPRLYVGFGNAFWR